MVKMLLTAAVALLSASQVFGLDWQRPDCSAFARESECINNYKNEIRRDRQQEFGASGLKFWYFERADFSDNKAVEKAFEDKLEGALLVSFTVEKDGSVSTVALKDQTSDAMRVYAGPVLAAVKNWQFVPMEATRPHQEWLFPFMFKQDACDEGEASKSCKEGDQPQGPHGPQALQALPASGGVFWSALYFDLSLIVTP